MPTFHQCRLCGAPLTRTFVDLGMSPLCESYVPEDKLDAPEVFYPLSVRLCDACLLVQLPAYVAGEDIFSDYAYFSSYSDSWVAHAKRYAEAMTERLGLNPGSLVTEVASNDGYLLQHFQAAGIPVLGVEPAANVAEAARARGIPTEVQFLGEQTGRGIARQYGRADLVAANNVFAHVPDIRSFAAGLRALVKDEGTVTLEFPHLLRLIERRQYDTIYHEHFSYLSLLTSSRCAGDGRAAGGRRGRTRHARRLAPRLRPSRRGRRRAGRAGEGGTRRRGSRGPAYRRRSRRFRGRGAEDQERPARIPARAAAKAAPWPGTAPRARGTRCSTTAASDRICSPTRSTGARSSKGNSSPARIFRSTRRSAWPRPGPTTYSSCPGTLREEITRQLHYAGSWGAKLVFPIPELQVVSLGSES